MAAVTIPAQLWVGARANVRHEISMLLQRELCPERGCASCSICRGIAHEQHHSIIWIRPEKQYTRDILEPIFNQLAFALDPNQQFFFILEDVDFMPSACANSLLKSLEEPPAGYRFFLCAQRMETILPTIRSRCLIRHLAGNSSEQPHLLFDYFTSALFYDPLIFLKELEQSAINEQESIELVDQLLMHWMRSAKKAVRATNERDYAKSSRVLGLLEQAFKKLPMPGSSKLFWKDLYLAIKAVE